jgi:predicted enzyme related to lactoylglutathione lyase
MPDIDVLFASIPVNRLDSAVSWYEGLFGRAPDIVPNDDEVMWRIADAAWLYVIHDEVRAGQSVVAMCVPELDRTLAELRERGIPSGPVEDVGDGGRKALITDPDGNQIAVIEVPARG